MKAVDLTIRQSAKKILNCYDFADIWGTEEFSNWSVPQRAPDMKQDQAKQTKLSMKKVQIDN